MTDRDPNADLDWLYARNDSRDRAARPPTSQSGSAHRPAAHANDLPPANASRSGELPSRRTAAGNTGRHRGPGTTRSDAGKRPRISTPGYDDQPATAQATGSRTDSARVSRPRTTTPAYGDRITEARVTDRPRAPRTATAPDRSGPASGTRPPDTGRPPAERRSRRRRLPRPLRWLRAIGLVLLIWLVYLVAVPAYSLSQMPRVAQSSSTDRPPEQLGTAILLVGSDARADDPNFQPRADTILLLYRPPTGQSVLVSLPRDSYVPVPGHGQTKLNAAYAYGGQPLLIDTVELVTGVRIDGYLEVGFEGFSGLVNSVGGVEVCPTEPMVDEFAQIDLPAGCQTIDGSQALGYVRSRYTDVRGDIGRAERQREIITKVVKKAASPTSVLNPVRYWKLNMAAAGLASRGEQTSFGDLYEAGRAMLDISGGNGLSLVVPIADPAGWSDDGQSVVIWDRENALALFNEISRGDTSNLARFAD